MCHANAFGSDKPTADVSTHDSCKVTKLPSAYIFSILV